MRIEIDGVSLITDPLFAGRLLHLRRHGADPDADARAPVDAILLSHLHLDHADLRSLRELGAELPVIAPPGAAGLLARKGFSSVAELGPGGSERVGAITVAATPAAHSGRRWPFAGHRAETCGFAISGSQEIYFAGDTDLFDEMGSLFDDLDLAFVPVWGWGTTLGEGHLDPKRAARAVALMRPRLAVPIHWGTLFPFGLHRRHGHLLSDPPREFARETRRLAPEVEVRVLEPGERTRLDAR